MLTHPPHLVLHPITVPTGTVPSQIPIGTDQYLLVQYVTVQSKPMHNSSYLAIPDELRHLHQLVHPLRRSMFCNSAAYQIGVNAHLDLAYEFHKA